MPRPASVGGGAPGRGARRRLARGRRAPLCLTLPLSSSVTSRPRRSNPLPPGTRMYDSEAANLLWGTQAGGSRRSVNGLETEMGRPVKCATLHGSLVPFVL